MKLVYYPSFFRLRRFGDDQRHGRRHADRVPRDLGPPLVPVVLAARQLLFAWQDMLFWAILGVLVVVGSLLEMKRGRKRRLGPAAAWSASRRACGPSSRSRFDLRALVAVERESLSEWLALWIVAGTVRAGRDSWLIAGLSSSASAASRPPWRCARAEAGKPRRPAPAAAARITVRRWSALAAARSHRRLYTRPARGSRRPSQSLRSAR